MNDDHYIYLTFVEFDDDSFAVLLVKESVRKLLTPSFKSFYSNTGQKQKKKKKSNRFIQKLWTLLVEKIIRNMLNEEVGLILYRPQ